MPLHNYVFNLGGLKRNKTNNISVHVMIDI